MNTDTNLKKRTISSTIWKFSEQVMAEIVSLIVSIVLARLLSPSDYSIIGVIGIFSSFASVLITGGLNTALIQKKNADGQDYFMVLITSVLSAILMYALFFFLAPFIASLYNISLIVPVTRIITLTLPVNAVKSVVCAYISSNLKFKKFFLATIGATIVSALVGISLAFNGFGVWALVAQRLVNDIVSTFLLLITTKIPFTLKVSFNKLSSLFKYGWKVLASSLLGIAYSQIVPIVIGLKFSPTELSYYTKGHSFPNLISSNTNNTFSSVLFPVMAKFQDNKEVLLNYTRRFIKVTSFVAFPLMLGFFAVSDNFIRVVLTEKWMGASVYIKVFCISLMFEMIHTGNCETIKAMGRSDIFLVMEIIKKSLYFFTIAVFLVFGKSPVFLASSSIVCTLVAIIVNCIPNITLIGYRIKDQIVDLLPNLLSAIIMCFLVTLIGNLIVNMYLSLLVQIVSGIIIYVAISVIIKNENFKYLIDLIKGFTKER